MYNRQPAGFVKIIQRGFNERITRRNFSRPDLRELITDLFLITPSTRTTVLFKTGLKAKVLFS